MTNPRRLTSRPVRTVRRAPTAQGRRTVSYALGSGGRYGNCLHQIASTVGIARVRGLDPVFPSDWPYRPFHRLPDEWFAESLADSIPASVLALSLPQRPRIYLQSLALWAGSVQEVRDALWWSEMAAVGIAQASRRTAMASATGAVCGVHVRRGDVVRRNPPDTIQPLPAAYYLDAVEAAGADAVILFTDDPEWCAENLPGDWVLWNGEPGPEDFEDDYLTRPRTDWIDLGLMALCDSVVISNSSFSWWAAWLGDCDTWYPSRWYGAKLRNQGFDHHAIIPPGWHEVVTT